MPDDEPDECAEDADDSSSDEGGEDEEDKEEEREAEDTDSSAMRPGPTTGVPGRGGERAAETTEGALVVTAGPLSTETADCEARVDTRDCPRPPPGATCGGVAKTAAEEEGGSRLAAEGTEPGEGDSEEGEGEVDDREEEEGKGESREGTMEGAGSGSGREGEGVGAPGGGGGADIAPPALRQGRG